MANQHDTLQTLRLCPDKRKHGRGVGTVKTGLYVQGDGPLSRLHRQVGRGARPYGGRGDDQIGNLAGVTEQAPHQPGGPAPPRRHRSLVIGGIVRLPVRFAMTKDEDAFQEKIPIAVGASPRTTVRRSAAMGWPGQIHYRVPKTGKVSFPLNHMNQLGQPETDDGT